jgi:hypothetical protein
MSFWTDAQLAAFRADHAAARAETASVISYTHTSDSMGGWDDTASGTVSVTARRKPAMRTGTEGELAGGVYGIRDWMIELPAGTTVSPNDRIHFSDQDYQVKAVMGPMTFEYARWVEASTIT